MEHKNEDYSLKKGDEYLESQKYEEAIKCYSEAANINQNNYTAFHKWGIALSNLAEIKQDETLFKEAIEKYKEASQLEPKDADVFNDWGIALYYLAEIKQDEALFKKAIEKYKEASQLKPDYTDIFYNWGTVLYVLAKINKSQKEKENLFNEAIDKYKEATQLEEEVYIYNDWGKALYQLAKIKEKQGEKENLFNEAIDKYKKATQLEKDPYTYNNWGKVLYQLAKTKEKQGEKENLFNEAIDKYKKATQLEKYPYTYNNWGKALYQLAKIKEKREEKENLFNEAIKKYKQAIKLNPKYAKALCYWGNALYQLAKTKEKQEEKESLFNEAIEKYEQASQFEQSKFVTFYNFYFCGIVLAELAKIKEKQEEKEVLFNKAFEKYKQALRFEQNKDSASILFLWGDAIYELAKTKEKQEEKEVLFNGAIEKYEQASQFEQNKTPASYIFCSWGVVLVNLAQIKQEKDLSNEAIEKYEEACKKYKQAFKFEQSKAPVSNILCSWGIALSHLAQIKQDKSLYKEAIEKYKKAYEEYKEVLQAEQNETYVSNILCSWGTTLSNLAKIIEDNKNNDNDLQKLFDDFYKESDRLKKMQKDILEIFVIFDDVKIKDMLINVDLHDSLLGENSENDEAKFFNKIVKEFKYHRKIDEDSDLENLDLYKKAYILSIYIISDLHVKNKDEISVAHYCKKNISRKIIFDDNNDSKFRLNTINYSNDPTEGATLLDFLFGNKLPAKKISNKEYVAFKEYVVFAGCFTFNQDSLNHFRLYGKEDGKEGTGLSLVFKESFFNKEAELAIKNTKEKKLALFRCIYIDPVTQLIGTVGQKEDYLFYREEKEKLSDENIKEKVENKVKKYHEYINPIFYNVKNKMKDLKDIVNKLEPELVGQLLINLRYLTKHIAFKEEQECRIVSIRPLKDDSIRTDKTDIIDLSEDANQIYINYQPKVSNNIEKIYFGPNATGIELFQDYFTYKNSDIICEKSKNPLG